MRCPRQSWLNDPNYVHLDGANILNLTPDLLVWAVAFVSTLSGLFFSPREATPPLSIAVTGTSPPTIPGAVDGIPVILVVNWNVAFRSTARRRVRSILLVEIMILEIVIL